MISLKRFKEFLRVAFGPNVRLKDWLAIFKASFLVYRSPYKQGIWRERIRICYKCPIFDKTRKTCRPFESSIMGCGCYVPYKALVKSHCWGRERFGKNFGW